VAQWQSRGLISLRSRVQVPAQPPLTTTRSIRATVLAFVREHDLLPPGPIVVAVSGGTDSVALLLLLTELAPKLGLSLHVAHFDHRLRPKAAARDAQFVADLAQSRGATIRIGRADAPPKSEDDARDQRYAFLRRAAREVGATLIATGHTRDDQAETVLLHLTRGSGIAGLAGMRPRRDDIVRPLLAIGRTETLAVCTDAKIEPRQDRSNADPRYARNRIRHKVLPELERINPQVRAALARLGDAAATASDAAQRDAERSLAAATTEAGIALDRLDPTARGEALALAWPRRTGSSWSGPGVQETGSPGGFVSRCRTSSSTRRCRPAPARPTPSSPRWTARSGGSSA